MGSAQEREVYGESLRTAPSARMTMTDLMKSPLGWK